MNKIKVYILIAAVACGLILGIIVHHFKQQRITQSLVNIALQNCDQNLKRHTMDQCIKLLKQADDRGSQNASFYLGQLYENGEGIKANLNESMKWFKRASQLGHKASTAILATPKFKMIAAKMRMINNTPTHEDWYISESLSDCRPPYKCIFRVVFSWRFDNEYLEKIYAEVFSQRSKTNLDVIQYILPCMKKNDGWPYSYILTQENNYISEPMMIEEQYRVKNCDEYGLALNDRIQNLKEDMIPLVEYDSFVSCGKAIAKYYNTLNYIQFGNHSPKVIRETDQRRYVSISINPGRTMSEILAERFVHATCSTPLKTSKYNSLYSIESIEVQLHDLPRKPF